MPLRSAAVGESTAPQILEVTARRTLAYAAGIGCVGASHLDDASEAGVIAPPPFCVSVEWPAVIAPRGNLGIAREEGLRGVHASQDSLFHRAIRPGDRLRTTLTIVGVRSIAPGAHLLSRLDTVDDRSGEPVVTSWSGTIYRGVKVDGPERQIDAPPPFPETPEPPHTAKVEIPIAREAPHVYTECASIWNPIHTERTVALAAGLPDIILHGTATWALAGREIVDGFADGDATRLRRLAGRFAAMVIPGTTIVFEAGASPAGTACLVAFEVLNAEGRPAIASGRALVEV